MTRRLPRSEKTYIAGTISLAIALIIFRGSGNAKDGLFGNLDSYVEETAVAAGAPTQYADIQSLFANNGSNVVGGDQGGNSSSISFSAIQDNSFQASDPASTDYLESFKADQVIQYTVQSGDSVSTIASNYGVSVDTVIWANNIRNPDALTPGQTLKIPPVSGVIHTVQSGDTVASIAKKYSADADKILAFNKLDAKQTLIVGDQIMVPGGEMPGPKPVVRSVARGSSPYVPVGNGQCVAFVRAHGYAALYGNAYQWARYINTTAPAIGGVVVMRGGRYGHVALVTAVNGDSIQIVEQNWYGLYIIDHRQISLSDKAIVGFIR